MIQFSHVDCVSFELESHTHHTLKYYWLGYDEEDGDDDGDEEEEDEDDDEEEEEEEDDDEEEEGDISLIGQWHLLSAFLSLLLLVLIIQIECCT